MYVHVHVQYKSKKRQRTVTVITAELLCGSAVSAKYGRGRMNVV